MDFDEAREIVDLARKKRLQVACAPVMLLYPVYEHVRSLVLGGAIGTVASARVLMANPGPNTWQFKSDPGWFFREKTASKIPPVPDLAVYGISFLTRVFGPAKRVSAMASLVQRERRIDKVSAPGFKPYTIRPRIDDSVVVSIEYANGVLATIASNYTTGGRRPDEYEFYGTEGTLTMPLAADRFSIQSTLPPHDKPAELHDVSMAGKRGGVFYEEWQWGPILVTAHSRLPRARRQAADGRELYAARRRGDSRGHALGPHRQRREDYHLVQARPEVGDVMHSLRRMGPY